MELVLQVLALLVKFLNLLASLVWAPLKAYFVGPVMLAYKAEPSITVPVVVGWMAAAWIVAPTYTDRVSVMDRIFRSMQGGFYLTVVHLVFLVFLVNFIAGERFVWMWLVGAAFWMFIIYSLIYPLFKFALKWALILSLIAGALLVYKFIQENSGPLDVTPFLK